MTREAWRAAVARWRSPVVGLGSLGALGGLWLVQHQGPPDVGRVVSGKVDPSSAAVRPARVVRLDFGTPAGRFAIRNGFEADEREGRRTFVRTKGERSTLAVQVAPEDEPFHLAVEAKVTAPGPANVGVMVNGTGVGSLTLGSAWERATLDVPGRLFLAGRNDIDLVASTPVLLDMLELTPLSARLSLDPTKLAAEDRRGPDGRALLELGPAPQELSFELRPESRPYLLGLVLAPASSEVEARLRVFVNDIGVGEHAVSAGGNALIPVPSGRLAVGRNRLGVGLLGGSPLLLERVTLAPIGERAVLDVGSSEGRPLLVKGFGNDDRVEHRSCAWSVGSPSGVVLAISPAPSEYQLTVSAQTFAQLAPLSVAVTINGVSVGSLTFVDAFSSPVLVVAPGVLRQGLNEIDFTYAKMAQPSAIIPGSSDPRQLAVRFDWIALEPVPRD